MGFKQFRFNIVLRVLLLTSTCLALFITLNSTFTFTPILVAGLIIYQVWSLIRYVDRTNRELAGFLESIRYSEFTRTFQISDRGSSFNELNAAFNDVMRDFQQVRSEREEHFHYLQSIVQSIDVSILAYQRDGTVEMINPAAKKLFQVNSLRNINMLRTLSEKLANTLLTINPGENKLVKVQDEEDLLQLAIFATEFKVKDKVILLSTIKNIQNVLEEQETAAWQKLIRVLTHEIMNSIAPISSLSSTVETMVRPYTNGEKDMPDMDMGTIHEIQGALQTINKRSTGLMNFVETYRSLARIPEPNFAVVKMQELIQNVHTLMKKEAEKKNITLSTSMEPDTIEVQIDEQLIEQVLINLIKNSVQALGGSKEGQILIRGFYNKRGRPSIQVIDNGQGILDDVIDKVFIPFFTTKRSGSGIGLSLSRQILRLHGGTITAKSIPNEETIFTMTF
ncbi:MAG: ATP-binding protein [Bacteroidia bacterium]|nr:MAG: ATP-binding protein [Bacteroidia bacterium]